MVGALLLATLLLACAAFFVGRAAGLGLAAEKPQSRPAYHGAFLALAVALPGVAVVLGWAALQPGILNRMILDGMPADVVAGLGADGRELLLAQVRALAGGAGLPDPGPAVVEAAARLARWRGIGRLALFAACLGAMLAGFLWGHARIAPGFRARGAVERVLTSGMLACASVALLAIVALVAVLARQTAAFFGTVPPVDFLFGTTWDPQVALRADQVAGAGDFGAVPVLLGTALVAGIAMAVAAPLGLLVAIHLVEYARAGTRAWAKPLLEILAGVPTVVYGVFALVVVAPAVARAGAALGLEVSPNSTLAVGLVTGIMILPLVSSLADDALRAVPGDLRDASLALGATRAETIVHVLLPAALPGVVGALLLALSRAVGETMIVLLAAGFVARMTLDPLASTTTVTVQIAGLLVGDAGLGSPRTLAAYALGLTLFAVTFGLNLLALRLVRRARLGAGS